MQRTNAPAAALVIRRLDGTQWAAGQVVRNVHAQQGGRVVAVRVVLGVRLADVRAHQRLLAALLVVVALREGRLAEARHGQILFSGVQGQGEGSAGGVCSFE